MICDFLIFFLFWPGVLSTYVPRIRKDTTGYGTMPISQFPHALVKVFPLLPKPIWLDYSVYDGLCLFDRLSRLEGLHGVSFTSVVSRLVIVLPWYL